MSLKTPSSAARKIQNVVRQTRTRKRITQLRKSIGNKNTIILQILYETMKIGIEYQVYTREEI